MKTDKNGITTVAIVAAFAAALICGCASPQNQTYDVNVYIQNVERNGVAVYENWRNDSFWNGNDSGDHYVIWYEHSPNGGKTVGLHFVGGKYDKDNAVRGVSCLLRNIVNGGNNSHNIHRLYVTDTERLTTLRLK